MKITRSKSLFAFAPASMVAVLCGLLDSSVWVAAYWNDFSDGSAPPFSAYYAIAIPCKAAILLIFTRTVRINNARLLRSIYLPIGITVFFSILMGNTTLEGVIQPVGALVSLAMTITILSDENIGPYMKTFGLSCLMCCATFLFLLNFVPLNTRGIFEIDGRYTFIFGTQPNLGGEILFTGFIAFCIARLNTKLIVATFALYLISLNLLQSRAAILSLLLAFILYIYVEKIRWFAPGSRVALVAALALLFALFCVFNMESISKLFLLQDEYRGVGTGYVGREDHWETAWLVFLHSPFVGVGFGFFRHDVVTPHSMWLGMLSMMGLMSIFILVAMVQNGLRIYAANTTMFLLLLSFIPMTVFNDRFLNLNPYPFLLFVILFLPRKALTANIQRRELPAVRHRGVGAKAI